MIQEVRQIIKENKLLEYGDKVVVGVSGGADSVCLFLVLLELRKEYNLTLFVVHINHGIRGKDADADEKYVRELCEKYDVSFICERVNIRKISKEEKISEEEAGRKLRYEAFNKELVKNNANKIAVAHNENDRAETVLFQLFRGSGLKGLSGIKVKRGNIIRPLLYTTRADIEKYLIERDVSYCTDLTNKEEIYSRNKIRIKILPYIIKELNEKAVEHIARSSELVLEAEEYITENAKKAFENIVRKNVENRLNTTFKIYEYNVEDIEKENIVIQKLIIREILEKLAGKLKDITYQHVKDILKLQKSEVGKKINLPYGIIVEKTYKTIEISKEDKTKIKDKTKQQDEVEIKDEYESLNIEAFIPGIYKIPYLHANISLEIKKYEKNDKIPKNQCTKWLDYDKIKNAVKIRTRQEQDYIQINNLGQQKKIKSYFIDKKIPQKERKNIPLLTDGNHVIWIIGDRISEAYKVSEKTKNILVVNLNGGKENV